MPRGLIFPFFFGMYVLRAGRGRYDSVLRSLAVSSNHCMFMPSRVSSSVPLTMLPALDFMVS